MRLSREKIVRLSHAVTDVLVASEEVEFIEDRDTIRQQIVQILQTVLKEEEQVDAEVRRKIGSQKREILEGSEEWDILYRKYYGEELKRMGIQHHLLLFLEHCLQDLHDLLADGVPVFDEFHLFAGHQDVGNRVREADDFFAAQAHLEASLSQD